MNFWRAQFDKILISLLFLISLGATVWLSLLGVDKLVLTLYGLANNFAGCLLTLVVGRHGSSQESDQPAATSSTTTVQATTVSKTEIPLENKESK